MSTSRRLRIFTAGAIVFVFATVLAPAQQPAAPVLGRIHGRVINPAGVPQRNGTVSLSTDGGVTLSYNFPVSATGEYAGDAPEGEYTVVYRAPDTPEGKIVDYVREVEVVTGQDTAQDIDMTRQEFFDRLTPEQQRQLLAMRQANAAAQASNNVISALSADLKAVSQDFQDAQDAREIAAKNLGATADNADIDAMATDIRSAKFADVETLMTKDTAANPAEPALWIELAQAELDQRNFLDAETNYKKALDLESKNSTPRPQIVGAADAGLGEVYARTLMVDEANAAFDAAAEANPTNAASYLLDQAIVFFQEKNTDAQVDAANAAIKIDPNDAILYYIKAVGLATNATVDPATKKILLPPGCAAALRKYLKLAPNGAYAADVAATLEQAKEPLGDSGAPPNH